MAQLQALQLTPLTKMNLHYLSALRIALSIMLTWIAALQFDLPASTAAMSAAAISLIPSRGEFFIKALGRVVGTLMGFVAVIFICAPFSGDSYHFVYVVIGVIIVGSIGISLSRGSFRYSWPIFNLTVASICFPIINSLSLDTIIDSVINRGGAILISVICSILVQAVIPSEKSTSNYVKTKAKLDDELTILLSSFMTNDIYNNAVKFMSSIRGYKKSVNTIKSDPTYYDIKELIINPHYYYLLLYKLISLNQFAVKSDIDDGKISEFRDLSIQTFKSQDSTDVVEFINNLEESTSADVKSFTDVARDFTDTLTHKKSPNNILLAIRCYFAFLNVPAVALAFVNALRVFIALMCINEYSVSTQWDFGYQAMMNTAISLSMLMFVPIPNFKALKYQFITKLGCILFALFFNFSIMPSIDNPIVYFTVNLLLIYVYSLVYMNSNRFKLIGMYYLLFWSIFIDSSNIPSYDFSHFINQSTAVLLSLIVCTIMHLLISDPDEELKFSIAIFFANTIKKLFRIRSNSNSLIMTLSFINAFTHTKQNSNSKLNNYLGL
ncbi:hypothetical protein VIN01S_16000 [Vibrio inusitatus NBRC 102082]|uniref:Fusaric acid resistance protein n=1 Tax=Vibrio inusitatus NBRC 102082 TaxID=1219070 RepID=A0A4Y3HUP1_9VIBR|nr:FUSC family protein [Vibrio inusitatus]GEA50796.1 hypothetical protein VIN01S_16000 [Vibrio inusitatus NBRC 102082]